MECNVFFYPAQGLAKHERPGGAEQTLNSVHEEEVSLSGSTYPFGAHVVLQHVDEGGVKLAVGMVVGAKNLTRFRHLQFLESLSRHQVETPQVFGWRVEALVLTDLTRRNWVRLKCPQRSLRQNGHMECGPDLNDKMFRTTLGIPFAP